MVHFCHLLFPDYAQTVSTAQPTEPTAEFPNCPKISFSQMGLDFHQALTVRFKSSIFFLLQKQHNRAKLVLSVIPPCLWQYLLRCNSITKTPPRAVAGAQQE